MPRRTISKAAREAGVGIETVRFYERSGVLPKPDRPSQGWRQYPDASVWTIRYVKDAQKMGFSLSECKAIVANAERITPPRFCQGVRAIAEDKLKAVEAELKALAAIRKEIKGFLLACKSRERAGGCPIFERISMPSPKPTRS